MTTGQIPHDDQAEAALLGAVLVRREALAEAGRLEPEDFYNPRHRSLWKAFRNLEAEGKPIDAVTVEYELIGQGTLRAVGLDYLSELALKVLTPSNAAHYAARVREQATTRRLLLGLSSVVEKGRTGTPAPELFAEAHKVLREYDEQDTSFASAADRIEGEAERRAAMVARELRFNISFLDDFLRGILPHDLIVLGARTGAGKTQLAQIVALTNAERGKRVYLLALEAEPDEIERRTKFSLLARFAYEMNMAGRERLNYPDWYRGKCKDLVEPYEGEVDKWIQRKLRTLHTLYRGRDFTVEQIEQQFRAIRDRADLIILDHIHYVDSDDPNENRAVRDIIKRIRDVSLAIGVPVIVVAHLRKKDRGRPGLLPDIDDFHGSSDLTKIATAVVLLSRARDQESSVSWLANTYVQVPKSRMGGACPFVAMVGYDLRRNAYEKRYMLGRASLAGDEVSFLAKGEYPRWAIHGGDQPEGERK